MPRLEAMVRAHAQEILCLKAHPLKGSFVTGGNDKRVRVWSLQSYELLATLEGHTEVRAGLYPTPNLTSNPHPRPRPRLPALALALTLALALALGGHLPRVRRQLPPLGLGGRLGAAPTPTHPHPRPRTPPSL